MKGSEPMNTIKDKTILLVDDEPAILQMCKSILKENGFENILTANTALSALEKMSVKPDMAVLDVMLPDMDGFTLAKAIHEQNIIPILFLTAKGEIKDKSKGFEVGADDYIVKPFIAQEFVWRITAILRRTYKEGEETSFLLNSCKVDLEQAEVYREGQEPVTLTAKEVEILKKLYANAGRIVTLGALCQTVCGDIYIGYEKTLMSHIRHIREKIEEEPSSPVSLITVKGIGYKLVLKDKTR
jgi:DNA-binding response OmpR family regulator